MPGRTLAVIHRPRLCTVTRMEGQEGMRRRQRGLWSDLLDACDCVVPCVLGLCAGAVCWHCVLGLCRAIRWH